MRSNRVGQHLIEDNGILTNESLLDNSHALADHCVAAVFRIGLQWDILNIDEATLGVIERLWPLVECQGASKNDVDVLRS